MRRRRRCPEYTGPNADPKSLTNAISQPDAHADPATFHEFRYG
jgi:hypothetical protein